MSAVGQHDLPRTILTLAASPDDFQTPAHQGMRRVDDFNFGRQITSAIGSLCCNMGSGAGPRKKPWKVRLLFAREVATYIRERVWHTSQELRQRRDGSLEMRLETSGRKELTRWILSWMPHVRVLAPLKLRDRVRERMRQGLARQRPAAARVGNSEALTPCPSPGPSPGSLAAVGFDVPARRC